jgi:toxin ParE1/3/4
VKVILSPDALADMQEIGDFIAEDNIDAAERFVTRLKLRCFELGTFPNAGRRREEIIKDCRTVTEGDYVIFYRVRSDDIEILHVLHGKRDFSNVAFADSP